MTSLLIPEDKLLDVPDEVLFSAAKLILQTLHIKTEDLQPTTPTEELDKHYQRFLQLIENN